MKKLLFSLAITLLLLFSAQVWGQNGYMMVDSNNQVFCSYTYPTQYEAISFQIWEKPVSGLMGFTKSQTVDKQLILKLPKGFKFKTILNPGIVECPTSSEVVIRSYSFTSDSTLRVIIRTASSNVIEDAICFSGFEVRAMGPNLTGKIIRLISTAGNEFLIDNKKIYPTVNEPFKYLSSRYPFVYNSCTVTHPAAITDSVSQYSLSKVSDINTITKTMILKMNIKGIGLCSAPNLQSLTFSTQGNNSSGTDSLQNILRAVVYYNNVDNLNGVQFFGDYTPANYNAYPDTGFSKQDTSFTIYYDADSVLGMTLLSENNYFWLCYDIAGDAYTDSASNRLDAKLKSFVLNGATKIPAAPNPIGYRVIKSAKAYYSIQSGDWSSTRDSIWTIVDNGKWCHCQPNGDGIIIINPGHQIELSKDRTVDQIEITDGYLNIQSAETDIKVNYSLKTFGTGSFKFAGDFNIGFDLILTGTGLAEFHKQGTIGRNLYVGSGTILDNTSSSTFDLRVRGNLTVYGLLRNSGGQGLQVVMDGNHAEIEGTGTIQASQFTVENGHKKVKPITNLYLISRFLIRANSYVENFGKMNIRDEIDGEDDYTSYWINRPNSVLEYGGLDDMFFKLGVQNGYLNAQDDFNTVIYSRIGQNPGASAQNIIQPLAAVYYHLVIKGPGARTLLNDINLHGDLTTDTTLVHANKTITVDGTLMQYFKGDCSPTLYNLYMNNCAEDGGLTLQLPVYYSGNLRLDNGRIFTTMTNILTANTIATATSGNNLSFVHGPMQKIGNTAFNFPVGKNNKWARIGISAPISTETAFIAEYFDEKYSNTDSVTAPLDHVSTQEYWNLKGAAKATEPVTVKLFWEDGTFSGINDYSTDFVVAGWSGTSWLDRGQSEITGSDPGNITSNIVSIFDAFTFGSRKRNGNPLPINLLNFDAKLNNGVVNILWTTQTETNNDYFTVEKSKDAVDFQMLTKVKGAGNSNQILNYQTNDYMPYDGVTYYRLKQTDFDGNSTYSKIAEVIYAKDHASDIKVYPNPFTSEVNFDINVESGDYDAELSISNMMGVEVINEIIKGKFATLDTEMLPKGVYTYKIEINFQTVKTGKLVKQ